MATLFDMMVQTHAFGVLHQQVTATPPTIFQIDNVADYFADHAADRWQFPDFPVIAPPYPWMWMEWRSQPFHTRIASQSGASEAIIERRGVLLFTREWNAPEPDFQYHQRMMEQHAPNLRDDQPRWAVLTRAYRQRRGHTVERDIIQTWHFVRPDGTPHSQTIIGVVTPDAPAALVATMKALPPDQQTEHMQALVKRFWDDELYVTLLALAFLNCKNVLTTMQTAPSKLAKAHVKKHGQPLVRWHVLQIDPMKEVLAYEGRSTESGLKRALHICRGHFVTYDEKPAFGKHRGTYWRRAHVRGSRKRGLVLKDYQVNQPQEIRC